eukprot:10459778-Alexandrium_andersonii.AAC.1
MPSALLPGPLGQTAGVGVDARPSPIRNLSGSLIYLYNHPSGDREVGGNLNPLMTTANTARANKCHPVVRRS